DGSGRAWRGGGCVGRGRRRVSLRGDGRGGIGRLGVFHLGAAGAGVAFQALEVGSHVASGLVAQTGIVFERLGDGAIEVGGERSMEARGGNGFALEDRGKNYAGGVAGESLAAGGHFVEDEAERKEISAGVERLAANLFGRHVGDGAESHAGAGEIGIAV